MLLIITSWRRRRRAFGSGAGPGDETKNRPGQYVDMAMYECMVSHIESNMNSFQATGSNVGRSRDRLAEEILCSLGGMSPEEVSQLAEKGAL